MASIGSSRPAAVKATQRFGVESPLARAPGSSEWIASTNAATPELAQGFGSRGREIRKAVDVAPESAFASTSHVREVVRRAVVEASEPDRSKSAKASATQPSSRRLATVETVHTSESPQRRGQRNSNRRRPPSSNTVKRCDDARDSTLPTSSLPIVARPVSNEVDDVASVVLGRRLTEDQRTSARRRPHRRLDSLLDQVWHRRFDRAVRAPRPRVKRGGTRHRRDPSLEFED